MSEMAATLQADTGRQPLDGAVMRDVMGFLPTGVTLVTVGADAATEVMTVGSLLSVSLDPPLILISIGLRSRMRRRISAAGSFAVSMLSEDQADLSAEFARPCRPRGTPAFRRVDGTAGITGNALVGGAIAMLECQLAVQHPAGDHMLFIGRLIAAHRREKGRPLVFYRSRYTALQ